MKPVPNKKRRGLIQENETEVEMPADQDIESARSAKRTVAKPKKKKVAAASLWQAALRSEDGEVIMCKGTHAVLRWDSASCLLLAELSSGERLSLTQFEKHSGCGSKKVKESIRIETSGLTLGVAAGRAASSGQAGASSARFSKPARSGAAVDSPSSSASDSDDDVPLALMYPGQTPQMPTAPPSAAVTGPAQFGVAAVEPPPLFSYGHPDSGQQQPLANSNHTAADDPVERDSVHTIQVAAKAHTNAVYADVEGLVGQSPHARSASKGAVNPESRHAEDSRSLAEVWQKPGTPQLVCSGPGHIVISWLPPKRDAGLVVGYDVAIAKACHNLSAARFIHKMHIQSDLSSVKVEELVQGSYCFKV